MKEQSKEGREMMRGEKRKAVLIYEERKKEMRGSKEESKGISSDKVKQRKQNSNLT